jgi:glucan 1,3-beta-glucosidase
MRNLTFYNADTAIHQLFDWGWTYKGVSINNCSIGIDMTSLSGGAQSVGSLVLIDSEINNTPVGIAVSRDATSTPEAGGTLILENVQLNNVPVAVQAPGGQTVLPGSSGASTILAWTEGNEYLAAKPGVQNVYQGDFTPNVRPSSLTAGTDYYERSKPQYDTVPATEFLSVRDAGATGDGVTDDSDALIAVIAKAASTGQIVFFDAGYYLVTKTIYIPSGSRITGETYPVIMSSGAFFSHMSDPQPVVEVGQPGEKGTVEWSDMIVSTQGAQAGAILIQWNLDSSGTTPAGMWDVHSRIGGFLGSDLQVSQCLKEPNVKITSASEVPSQCIAAFMDMHITETAAGIYMENNWLWVADHDVDDPDLTQISIYAGRGLLIESAAGGNWLYGTAVEHHTMYQYQLLNTVDIFLGFIQTETAYYQPNPDAPLPFTTESTLSDPVFTPGRNQSGWGLRVVDSSSVLVYGAGHYSFFSNYNVTCSNPGAGETCQTHIVDIESSAVSIYGLNTVGTTEMVTLNGVDEAPAADNNDGFVSTIAIYRSSS